MNIKKIISLTFEDNFVFILFPICKINIGYSIVLFWLLLNPEASALPFKLVMAVGRLSFMISDRVTGDDGGWVQRCRMSGAQEIAVQLLLVRSRQLHHGTLCTASSSGTMRPAVPSCPPQSAPLCSPFSLSKPYKIFDIFCSCEPNMLR